jgi:hypothetical protein
MERTDSGPLVGGEERACGPTDGSRTVQRTGQLPWQRLWVQHDEKLLDDVIPVAVHAAAPLSRGSSSGSRPE